MHGPDDSSVGAVAAILAGIGDSILAADFAGLERQADALEPAIAALGKAVPTPGALANLRQQAERNRTLLDAARRGLIEGRARIAEVARVSSGVLAYAPDGRRELQAVIQPATIRRA